MPYEGHQSYMKNGESRTAYRDSHTFDLDIVPLIKRYTTSLASVCDVGAGNGRFLRVLKKHWSNSIGIEPAEYTFLTDGIKKTTMEHYSEKTFDILVMIGFIYIYEQSGQLNHLVSNIKRLLVKNGILVVAGDPKDSSNAFDFLCSRFFELEKIEYKDFTYLIMENSK